MMILYFCPDLTISSAGMRTIYRHVQWLVRNGLPAAVLHEKAGAQVADMPQVPLRHLSNVDSVTPGDILVVPESWPEILLRLQDVPLRRLILVQNWSFIYPYLRSGDYRNLNVERVLAYPQATGEFVAWAMGLPVHVFQWGINAELFYCSPEEKSLQICYIKRKQGNVAELLEVLRSRNSAFKDQITWKALDGLSEAEYAREIRRSVIFVGMSMAEGLFAPFFEAMRCGTIVAGYHGVGAQRELIGDGPAQNCILAENGDYPALARKLEPLLIDLITGNSFEPWLPMVKNGLQTSGPYTWAAEEASVVAIWREILAMGSSGNAC